MWISNDGDEKNDILTLLFALSATPSTDVIYWPPKVCPQTANSESRGETCIYLLPRSDSGGEREWPVQEVACSVPLQSGTGTGKSIYNYIVAMVPRFPEDQEGRTVFLQPPKSAIAEPVAYNMVIRAPATLHNHLPVPITFDICVSDHLLFGRRCEFIQGIWLDLKCTEVNGILPTVLATVTFRKCAFARYVTSALYRFQRHGISA